MGNYVRCLIRNRRSIPTWATEEYTRGNQKQGGLGSSARRSIDSVLEKKSRRKNGGGAQFCSAIATVMFLVGTTSCQYGELTSFVHYTKRDQGKPVVPTTANIAASEESGVPEPTKYEVDERAGGVGEAGRVPYRDVAPVAQAIGSETGGARAVDLIYPENYTDGNVKDALLKLQSSPSMTEDGDRMEAKGVADVVSAVILTIAADCANCSVMQVQEEAEAAAEALINIVASPPTSGDGEVTGGSTSGQEGFTNYVTAALATTMTAQGGYSCVIGPFGSPICVKL